MQLKKTRDVGLITQIFNGNIQSIYKEVSTTTQEKTGEI